MQLTPRPLVRPFHVGGYDQEEVDGEGVMTGGPVRDWCPCVPECRIHPEGGFVHRLQHSVPGGRTPGVTEAPCSNEHGVFRSLGSRLWISMRK